MKVLNFTEFTKDPHTDSVFFKTDYQGWRVICEITQEALDDNFTRTSGPDGWELETARANTEIIHKMASWKIDFGQFESYQDKPGDKIITRRIIIRSREVSILRRKAEASAE
ncbi:MAG: hypothetical protein JXQ27_14005 [Acidobacteria bacterium]|nr:hypothetical protein [Acidobacteriota bacterium]